MKKGLQGLEFRCDVVCLEKDVKVGLFVCFVFSGSRRELIGK